MTVDDVFDFISLENFINEHNRCLYYNEDAVIQTKTHQYCEYQLFFILKSVMFRNHPIQNLKYIFEERINGKYTEHQPSDILYTNPEGDIWVKTIVPHFGPFKNGEKEVEKSCGVSFVEKWRRIFEVERQIFFDDGENIEIIAMPCRVKKVYTDNGKRKIIQIGYSAKRNDFGYQCNLEPYDYVYQYDVITYEQCKQLEEHGVSRKRSLGKE